MTKILVVGGAGYIGSHMVMAARSHGLEVVVLDDLSTGYADAVVDAPILRGSIADRGLLDSIFNKHQFDAVMHFASFIQVGESVSDPAKYYENNVSATLNLLNAMRIGGVRRFIFSSSAAVYGNPEYSPIDELHPKAPINPYGWSKRMVEQILEDFHAAYGFRSVSLRYFNAAGADPLGQLGERHDPETHLIPLVLQVASGRRESISVYGTDYDTPDGTCVRDYIHVVDLCEAHLLALGYLLDGGRSGAFNLGNGHGFSVREVITAAEKVTRRAIPVHYGDRRAGDPARLVADSRLAREVLGWRPCLADLETIIDHAWKWERRHWVYADTD